MGKTSEKGDVGVAMVLADVMRRGHKVALPLGDDWPFDLLVWRGSRRGGGRFERVQCKFTVSNGRVIKARCQSASAYVNYQYTKELVDWIAVYDQTSDACYYLPARLLGKGRYWLSLRLQPAKNGQRRGIHYAKDYLEF